jgi:hypothetical protein
MHELGTGVRQPVGDVPEASMKLTCIIHDPVNISDPETRGLRSSIFMSARAM